MTAKDMVSQNTRKSCRLVKSMNIFEKKSCVPFLSSKPRPKKGRKHVAVNRQQTPLPAARALFTTKMKLWLREIEEHERKSDTSEKQSVEMSSLKPF